MTARYYSNIYLEHSVFTVVDLAFDYGFFVWNEIVNCQLLLIALQDTE